jgi:hypothetical protein
VIWCIAFYCSLGAPLCQSTRTFDRNPRYLVVEVDGTSEEHGNVEDLEVLNVGSWTREVF